MTLPARRAHAGWVDGFEVPREHADAMHEAADTLFDAEVMFMTSVLTALVWCGSVEAVAREASIPVEQVAAWAAEAGWPDADAVRRWIFASLCPRPDG